jgi:hypothetical protein
MAVVVASVLTVGCGGIRAPSSSPGTPTVVAAEVSRCEQSGYDGVVVGAFTLRAADLAAQDMRPRGPTGPQPLSSFYQSYPADTPVVLCFFDGFIAAPGGPPPIPPATFRPYDRYVVTVDPSGNARLAVAGHRDTIVVAPQLP